jgi:tryptophan synthase beta chain
MTTETGAGQWGTALSFATQKFGIECKVYMVRCSFDQKPYRKTIMNNYGGQVVSSPSPDTATGRKVLEETPDTTGTLGIAISEAVEDAALRDDTKYGLGSVLNHVILHQSIISLEAKKQFEMINDYPDVIVGCCGGGSNFAGAISAFVPEKLEGKDIRFIGVEPAACPTLTRGHYAYDYGDMAQTTPLLYMYTLGHDFTPPGIHAGGLRYHGMSPIVSALVREKIIEPVNVHQTACFQAGSLFAKCEGIIPAPESNHAIRATIDHVLQDKDKEQTVMFNLTGHGYLDLSSYEKFLAGELQDYDYPDDEIQKALHRLPKV